MVDDIQPEKTMLKKKDKRDYIYAVGREREAVARVRLYAHIKEGLMFGDHQVSKEQILINSMPIEHYFSGPIAKAYYTNPFTATNTLNKFAFTIRVTGGGKSGQLDAVVKGIARALAAFDEAKYRKLLKDSGFLTRDARVRERRKVGTGGKARRKKQSPKR